jgi:SOS-response transcriptional repressor LexA
MSVAERIKERRIKVGFDTQYKLAKAARVPAQVINQFEAGKRKKSRHLREIALALGVTVEYLLTGEVRLSSYLYSSNKGKHKEIKLSHKVLVIPVIRWEDVPKWSGMNMETVNYEMIPLHLSGKKAKISPDCFALEILNDSMQAYSAGYDSFLPGDIIIIDPHKLYSNNDFVIAILENKDIVFRHIIKTIDGYYLTALNPKHPSIALNDKIKIMGVLVTHQRSYL